MSQMSHMSVGSIMSCRVSLSWYCSGPFQLESSLFRCGEIASTVFVQRTGLICCHLPLLGVSDNRKRATTCAWTAGCLHVVQASVPPATPANAQLGVWRAKTMRCTLTHVFSSSSWKYRLLQAVGALVQGPSNPELSAWQRPSACAPDSATISWSLKPCATAKNVRLTCDCPCDWTSFCYSTSGLEHERFGNGTPADRPTAAKAAARRRCHC